MELSIQQLAKTAGVTSRTLRHYAQIGLLEPSRTGANGYRFYDGGALVRLQRILLLRELGLGLEEIGAVLDREKDEASALRAHLDWIDAERDRLERQRAAVARTITALEEGSEIVAKDMFDGFDHTQFKEEVVERWGGELARVWDLYLTGGTRSFAEGRMGVEQFLLQRTDGTPAC